MCLSNRDLCSFLVLVLSSFGYAFYPSEDEADATVTVFGVVGAKSKLPCNISSSLEDDSVTLILWYKDDAASPIYSVDSRRGNFSQARHVSSETYLYRTHLNTLENPIVLTLDVMSEEDEGDYWCRVDFKKTRTRNNLIYLQLIDPPAKPIITDHTGEILESLIGPYNEGDRLLLICEVEGGKPLPSVTWWRESVQLDGSFEVSMKGVVRNELEIPALQRHDLMAVFTCQASNNNISVPTSTSVIVDMNFRPIDVHIEGGPRPIPADKSVELMCRTTGSRPSAVISWWLEHGRLKHGRDWLSEDGNVTTSILHFLPSVADADMQLSCRAENPLIPGSALEDSWKLEILYAPKAKVRISNSFTSLEIGQDVFLHCDIKSHPPVSRVFWKFEGREIVSNISAGITVVNQTLILQKLKKHSRGSYTCVGVNSEGEGESHLFYLPIQYAPTCKPGQKIIYAAARNEAVEIVCEVEADPPEVSFNWLFNKTLENVEYITQGLRSMATFLPKSDLEYGTMLCFATNRVGRQKEPCQYTLISAGPPEQVENCSVLNISHFGVTVHCLPGYNGGLRQKFVMEVHDIDLHKLRDNLTADEPRFVTHNLPSSTNFVLVLYAYNAKGRSEHVMIRGKTFQQSNKLLQEGLGLPEKSMTILVSITAVITGVLLTLLIILLVLKFRTLVERSKRKSKWKEENQEVTRLDTLKESKCDVCLCVNEEDDKVTCIMPELLSAEQTRIDIEAHMSRSEGMEITHLNSLEKGYIEKQNSGSPVIFLYKKKI